MTGVWNLGEAMKDPNHKTKRMAHGLMMLGADAGFVATGLMASLALMALTGLLMTASDTATFLVSRLYWTKLCLVALLLGNGTGLLAAERAARRGGEAGWSWLALVSGVSFVLWLVVLFFGVWLTAAA